MPLLAQFILAGVAFVVGGYVCGTVALTTHRYRRPARALAIAATGIVALVAAAIVTGVRYDRARDANWQTRAQAGMVAALRAERGYYLQTGRFATHTELYGKGAGTHVSVLLAADGQAVSVRVRIGDNGETRVLGPVRPVE